MSRTLGDEVKRFIKWLIDEDLAFTHLDEAVQIFKGVDQQRHCVNVWTQDRWSWDLTSMDTNIPEDYGDAV